MWQCKLLNLVDNFGTNASRHHLISGGKIWNSCKWCHLVVKFITSASGAIWWSNLEPMLVGTPDDHLVAIFATNSSAAIWWRNLQLMQVVPSGGQIWN